MALSTPAFVVIVVELEGNLWRTFRLPFAIEPPIDKVERLGEVANGRRTGVRRGAATDREGARSLVI